MTTAEGWETRTGEWATPGDRVQVCQHGFSSPILCPVCLHFGKIREAETLEREERAARTLKEALELERLDSDGPVG